MAKIPLIILLLFLAACGEIIPHEPDLRADEHESLQLWLWDAAMEDAAREIAAGFDMEVTVIPWGEYWSSLQTALNAGTGPDIFWMNQPNAAAFMPSGLIMDLTEFSLDLTGFAPVQYEPFMYMGRLYGLPMFYDMVALFYNRTLFDEAGMAHPPRRGWTWEEMREAALALTAFAGDEVRQFGIGVSHGTQVGTANFIFQAGGHMLCETGRALDIGNAGAMEALRFMHDLMHVDRVSPTPAQNDEMNALGGLFVSDMMAMEIGGLWRAALYYEFLGGQLGIAHLPGRVREASSFHNLAYTVSAHTRQPEAVAAFLAYAATAAHGDIVAEVFLPAHSGSLQTWLEQSPEGFEVFAEALEYAVPLQLAARNAGPAWDALSREMKALFSSEDAITDEAVAAINRAVTAVINYPVPNHP